jgi:hypothetical protein
MDKLSHIDTRGDAPVAGLSEEPVLWRKAAAVDKTLQICRPAKPSRVGEWTRFVADTPPHCVQALRQLQTSC